jgi:phosphoheptose isomerase
VVVENRDDSIRSWEKVRFLAGAFEGLRELAAARLTTVLVTNQAAVANDLGYQHIFAEQHRKQVAPGDVVIAITGSANSPNILERVRVATDHGATTVALLGFDGGVVKVMALHVLVRSDHYGFIEGRPRPCCRTWSRRTSRPASG